MKVGLSRGKCKFLCKENSKNLLIVYAIQYKVGIFPITYPNRVYPKITYNTIKNLTSAKFISTFNVIEKQRKIIVSENNTME